LLARRDVQAITELSNLKVNVGPRGGGSAITAARLFEQLKIPVTMTTEPQELGLEQLRSGEIAAVALLAGKPAPLVQSLKGDGGLPLIEIPFDHVHSAVYVPT